MGEDYLMASKVPGLSTHQGTSGELCFQLVNLNMM